jgi:hypothetical protein
VGGNTSTSLPDLSSRRCIGRPETLVYVHPPRGPRPTTRMQIVISPRASPSHDRCRARGYRFVVPRQRRARPRCFERKRFVVLVRPTSRDDEGILPIN